MRNRKNKKLKAKKIEQQFIFVPEKRSDRYPLTFTEQTINVKDILDALQPQKKCKIKYCGQKNNNSVFINCNLQKNKSVLKIRNYDEKNNSEFMEYILNPDFTYIAKDETGEILLKGCYCVIGTNFHFSYREGKRLNFFIDSMTNYVPQPKK